MNKMSNFAIVLGCILFIIGICVINRAIGERKNRKISLFVLLSILLTVLPLLAMIALGGIWTAQGVENAAFYAKHRFAIGVLVLLGGALLSIIISALIPKAKPATIESLVDSNGLPINKIQ